MNRRRLRNHRHAVLAVIVLALTVAPTAPASANDPLVRAVARDASGVTVDVRVGDVAIKRDGARDAVSIPGASVVGREGWPIVPSMTRLVAVPGGARVLVAVEHVAFAEYQDVDLAPQPRLVTDLQADPAAAADPIAYTQNAWFPANLASVERVGSWRGVETARLTLGIAQYNAAKRRLRVATELRVRVSWDGGTVASIDAAHARAMSAALLNAPAPDGAANAPAPGADTNVLIVVQDTYGDSPSVAELVSLYEGDGLTVEVEKIGDIGALEGTALKAHIQSVYDAATPPQLAGVVFVGDAGPGKIPVAEGPTGFTSDWPYAFLDGDDQLADIVVGRFPAANEDELALMVQKTIDWRAGENAGDYLGTAVLIAHKQGYPEKYTAVSEQIRTRTYALAAPSFSTQYGGEDATNATLTSEIDAGRMIVNYRGHGDAWSWLTWSSTSEFYKAEQVAGLANEDRPAIVFAVACDNADVTQSARSFGEAWMTRDGGATALVGAVHSSYTVPNHDFNRFLFESIYDDGVATLGDVLALANARLLAFYAADPVYRQYAEANVDMYIWLGDPFLKLPVEPAKAPSNFRAEPIDTSSVSLSWNDFVDGEDGFDVEESAEPAGPWSVAASLAAGATGYTRTGLAEAESRYFRAVSVIGGERHPSAVAKAQSLAVPPDNLSAAPLGTQSLRVAWRDNSNGETGYRVMLREEGKTDFVFAALAGADAESAEAGGLAEATRYDALVEAVTAGGAAPAAAPASAFTMPAAPTGLTASAKPGGGVSLAFTNRSSGQAGFAVYRKMSGDASFAAIGETVSETYFDAAAPAGATLVYAVAAFTTDGEGPPGVPALVDTAPVAPSDLSVTPIDETSVLVEWTPAGGGEQMIFRSRAEDDGGFLPIATLPAGASSIVDAELHECERATWIVRMYAGEAYDESPWVESRALPMAPAAFEAIPDAGGVGLTWTDMSDGEMGYVVERATDGGAFEEIAALGENAQAYTDDPHAGAHVYRVAAFHEYGKAYSGEDSVVEDGAATDDDGPDDDGEDDDDAADDDDDFAERDEDDDSGCGC